MLKTQVGQEYWCVEQPDHGVIAGYLAAHWGNSEFRWPGTRVNLESYVVARRGRIGRCAARQWMVGMGSHA